MTDDFFMRKALQLAKNAEGRTSPNPLVGAVIVRDGRIVAEGWHQKAGAPHAEINALKMAGELARGATLYVTLEPCSHFGRTPPCVQAIIDSRIKKVVAAMRDPNPKVSGNGFKLLISSGIEVTTGILENEARKLNEVFLKWIEKDLPFVTLKFACSIDGKIATVSGESKWISSIESRKFSHHLRDINDAVLVGIGTILADDPSLTTRLDSFKGKNPIRVIVDSLARIPINSRVVQDNKAQTIIATTDNSPIDKIVALKNCGVEIISTGNCQKVDLKILMRELARREITSVLVEGGGNINFSMLEAGLVDRVLAFVAPKIIGGTNALTAVEGTGFFNLNEVVNLKEFHFKKIGEDILLSGDIQERLD